MLKRVTSSQPHYSSAASDVYKRQIPAFDMVLSNTQIRANVRTNLDYFTLNIGAQAGLMKNKNNIIKPAINKIKQPHDIKSRGFHEYPPKSFWKKRTPSRP